MVSVSLKFIQPRIPTCLGSLGENYNVILIVCMTSGTLCGPYIPTTMLSLSKQPIKSANPSRGTTIPRASLKTRQLFTNLRTTIIEWNQAKLTLFQEFQLQKDTTSLTGRHLEVSPSLESSNPGVECQSKKTVMKQFCQGLKKIQKSRLVLLLKLLLNVPADQRQCGEWSLSTMAYCHWICAWDFLYNIASSWETKDKVHNYMVLSSARPDFRWRLTDMRDGGVKISHMKQHASEYLALIEWMNSDYDIVWIDNCYGDVNGKIEWDIKTAGNQGKTI